MDLDGAQVALNLGKGEQGKCCERTCEHGQNMKIIHLSFHGSVPKVLGPKMI